MEIENKDLTKETIGQAIRDYELMNDAVIKGASFVSCDQLKKQIDKIIKYNIENNKYGWFNDAR